MKTILKKIAAMSVLIPTFGLTGIGMVMPTIAAADTDPTTVQVTITKYVQGAPATATTASSTSFLMSATWSADNIGTGTGQYSLAPGGGTPYQAATALMSLGADYSTNELSSDGSSAVTTCSSGQRYVLEGYTTGNTQAEAASSTPSMVIPAFTNLQDDKYVIVWNRDCTIPVPPNPAPTSKVTIAKYIEGAPATATTASSTSFLMSSTWNASNLGSSTGQYTLSPGGATPYMAQTSPMNNGASYSTQELDADGSNATTTCASGQRYVLSGYSTGNTWAQAASSSPSMTIPSFTNLQEDKYVIVWNKDCTIPAPTVATTSKVHILKYVDGVPATASTTSGYMFPMTATWQADNLNSGATSTASYFLGNNHGGASNMYGADTASMNNGYYYTTSEQTGTTTGQVLPQGSSCVEGKYRLDGYKKSSVSFAAAASSTLATTSPVWTNTSGDQYLIVYNTLCHSVNGTTTDNNVPLSATVTPIKTSALADNTWENGWKYMFNITAPMFENKLSMKFSDWVGAIASSTIPAGGNMRISSNQAASSTPILITAANTYSAPMQLNSDLDSMTPGRQIQVLLEVKIPFGTVNTSYTTSYGIQTLP